MKIDSKIEEGLAEQECRLEALELKVQEQEELIIALQNEKEERTSATELDSNSISASNVQLVQQSTGRILLRRTCGELYAANPALSSGMHWIDPDGQGTGEDAIHVYCDMKTGKPAIG